MANKEELKSMVLQFKVADLQLLLGFAGQNKIGRKSDLQKKALNLINYKMSIPLEMKIRQMYRDIIPENNTPKPNNNGYCMPQSYQDKYDSYYTNGSSRQSASNLSYDANSLTNYYANSYIDNYYDNYWSSLNYPNYSHSGRESHTPKVTSHAPNFNIKMPSNQNLSNIKFKKLPFYKYKSDILSVTPLMPKKQHGDSYEFTHSFSLSQDQVSLLNFSKKNDEYRYQVQLRMCMVNDETEVGDDLPLALTVKVNDKNCQLPPAIPSTNKQGMLLKRMNAPINLSSQTSKKNCVNNVFISWSVTCDRLYGIGIFLVKKFTADELIDKLKANGERDPEITKKYLSDKLGQLEDDDIAATSLKVSMICPLGKILMSLPVRATTCNHLQCFDGALYIKMNDVKSTWQCPVCNQSCYYDDLFIDGYFVNVLKNNQLSTRMSEIQIEADGSVTPVVPKKRSNPSSSSDSTANLCKKIKLEKTEPSSTENPDPSVNPSFSSSLFSSNYISISSSNVSRAVLPSISQPCDDPGASAELDGENQAQKSVVLVDLTESDSETEDQPLNLKKYKDRPDSNPESYSPSYVDTVKKISPPVYDIDDLD